MSAAFALVPTGPPVRCDYPRFALDAFHDDGHLSLLRSRSSRRTACTSAVSAEFGSSSTEETSASKRRISDSPECPLVRRAIADIPRQLGPFLASSSGSTTAFPVTPELRLV